MLRVMPRDTLGDSIRNRALRDTVRAHALVGALLSLLSGCSGCSKPAEPAPERTTPGAPSGEGDVRAASDPGTPALVEETTAGEGGGLALHGDPTTDGRRVAIRLANTGTAQVELAAAITVEREVDGTWSALDGVASITLRRSCEVEAPPCTTLAPGAEFFPPDWLGTIGDAQCMCTRCGPASAGRYRFVVRSCHGARRYDGDPFDLR
jgi:hypothetical protein